MAFALPYAIKSISRRKKKNLITSLAIALGVALFIGAQAGSDGVISSISKINLDNIGNIDITITDPTSTNGLFNESLVDLIDTTDSDLNSILTISPRIIYSTTVYASESGLLEEGIRVRGIQPGDLGFGEFEDEDGVKIKLEDHLVSGKVIISDLLAAKLNLSANDEIQFSMFNGLGNSITEKLIVSTIYDELKGRGMVGASPKETTPQLYINLDDLQSNLDPLIGEAISEISLTFNGIDRGIENFDVDGKDFPGKDIIKNAVQKLEEIFTTEFPGGFVFSARVNFVERLGDELIGLTSFLTIFAVMLNATALLLIINVQNMSIDDRKNQTAVLRALGSSISTIFAIFVLESAIVGIVGALVGFLLGYIVSIGMLALLSDSFGVKITGAGLTPDLMIVALIIGVLLSVVTAVLPSLGAARQGVANALRGLEDPKKPRRGFVTLFLGVIFLPLGLSLATQVGNIFDIDNWTTYENQTTILLGFGLTLAGLGMLLTLVLPRRLALSISGASMWGLGAFFTTVGSGRVKSGDPGNWFLTVLLFIIIGGTLLVSVNYESLMNLTNRILFFFTGLKAISQVTTSQMVGKKSRGVLVFTILTIILFLMILISIYSATMRVGAIELFDRYSDGVDIVVTTDNAFIGTADRIKGVDSSIENVFAFRRTVLPIYFVSPLDPNLDVSTDVMFVPIIEVPSEIINPDDDWNEVNSLQLSFRTLSDEIEDKTGHTISTRKTLDEHKEITKDVFEEFYEGSVRNEKVEFGDDEKFEDQVMIMSSWAIQLINLEFLNGVTVYLQTSNGGVIPTYVGGSPWIDMMGSASFPLFGNAILVTPTIAAQLPFDVDVPNLFLVRSSNGYNENEKNHALANNIEIDLNNLEDPTSFSSINGGNLIGGSATVIKDVVEDYWFEQVAFADAFTSFASMGLIIGALGMMIIAFRSVSERTREIGMMRSIGFSRRSVVTGVLIEMVTISTLGLIVGMIDGVMFAASVIVSDLGIPPVYPFMKLLGYTLGVIGLGFTAGAIAGYNASKITPGDALRYTG